MRRPGICGAVETILIHSEIVNTWLQDLINALSVRACEIRGCKETQQYSNNVVDFYPTVSVVIALRNEASRVERLIQQLESQNYSEEHFNII